MIRARYTWIWIVLLIIAGCGTTRETQQETSVLASLYNPSEFSLSAEYRVFHESPDQSRLYFRLYPNEILFNQANEDAEYRAVVRLSYIIYRLGEDQEPRTRVDSSAITFKLDRDVQSRSAWLNSFSLELPEGVSYLMEIRIRDMQRGSIGLEHVFVNKKNLFTGQNFKILSATTGLPKFMNYFYPNEAFYLDYRLPGYDTVYVDYFDMESELPRAPLTGSFGYTEKIDPDTTLILPFADTITFRLPREGRYHFRVDPDRREGMTMFNFGPTFPDIKTEKDLLEPVFYLATLSEYRDLRRAENTKVAVDDFWLNRGSSMARSKELIRIYYNRVRYSNIFFTADKEGWKTDRGMVFILFGPPDRMRTTGTEERWYYVSRRRGKVIEFLFERSPSVYTTDDFIWKKNQEALSYWNEAVSSWRKGKVFSLSN